MKIRFLGTGTSTGVPQVGCKCRVCRSEDPRDKRLRTSVMFTVSGKNILIDCGPDFRQQMLASEVDNIDAVLLTHKHYDHIAALDELRLFSIDKGLPLYLEKSVSEVVRTHLPYCFSENPYPGVARFDVCEIDENPFVAVGIPITPIRVMHYNLPILGFRIEDTAYITDMLTMPEEEYEKLQGLDILIINALRHTGHVSHQTLSDALSLVDRLKPHHTLLIHMSHDIGLHAEESCKLPDGVEFAYDGLEIDSDSF